MSGRRKLVPAGAGLAVVALVGTSVWLAGREEPFSRTPEETVDEFFAAHNAGDCEAMIAFLAEATWSQDGDLTEDEFVDHCAEVVAPRDDALAPPPLEIGEQLIEPDGDDPDRAIDTVSVAREGNEQLAYYPGDEVVLVRDGLTWKIGGLATGRRARREDAPVPDTRGVPVPVSTGSSCRTGSSTRP